MKKVLVFGDSLAEGVLLPEFDVTTACHPGYTTFQLSEGFPNLRYYLETSSYDIVVMIAGTNDLADSDDVVTPVRVIMDMANLALSLGVTPVLNTLMHDAFNLHLREVVEQSRDVLLLCEFLEDDDFDTTCLQDDGIHLTEAGCQAFSSAINETIR
jgi:lysophospholipase L1-like esterase